MTINFISYLDPFVYHGGGEQALRMVIQRGRGRGHDIRVFARRRGRLSKILRPSFAMPEADLYFLADVFNCPDDGCSLDKDLLDRIVRQKRYIHFDNAYVDVCPRAALPCGGARSECPGACSADASRWLYQRSLANVFVSPLHHKVISNLIGAENIPNPLIARPFIDVDQFHDKHMTRDIEYLYVGVISEYKGYSTIKSRFAGKDIVMIGRNATGEPIIGKHIPHVPHDVLPTYYNRAKCLVHLPVWPEPQGRCVVEGALCGCQLIINDNVGAGTFDFDITDRKTIADAPDHLWREVEALV